MEFLSAQKVLIAAGVEIDAGLTLAEFDRIEQTYGFRFPPDLREFLSIGLPVSRKWMDWRGADDKAIRDRLNWPLEGMCFDIERNGFWLDEWGRKPDRSEAAFDVARRAVSQAPRLIPICSHRYIPAEPNEPGNPVFSVYQTDIIYYGTDLTDYLQNEYKYYFGRAGYTLTGVPKEIGFWSALVS